MDLDTPRQHQFNSPAALRAQGEARQPEVSPFQGHLPAAPQRRWGNVSQEPQKVNPKEDRPLMPTGSMFGFRKRSLLESAAATQDSEPPAPEFAKPRFFAAENMATGLENLFSGFLSFDGNPPGLAAQARKIDEPYPTPTSTPREAVTVRPTTSHSQHIFFTAALFLASACWYLVPGFPDLFAPSMRIFALGTPAAISAWCLAVALGPSRFSWTLGAIVRLATLLAAGGFLYVFHADERPAEDVLGHAPQALLGVMLAHELAAMTSSRWRRAMPAAPSAPVEPYEPHAQRSQQQTLHQQTDSASPPARSSLEPPPQPPPRVRSPIDESIARLPPLPRYSARAQPQPRAAAVGPEPRAGAGGKQRLHRSEHAAAADGLAGGRAVREGRRRLHI